jgi:hypothetical protein
MTPRQVRRAAERKIRKQERKAGNGSVFAPGNPASSEIPEEPIEIPESPLHLTEENNPSHATPAPISASQLAANRVNSQLSTGPKTPEGKAKSSLNAVKTALTGRTVLLPTDDAAAYQQHVDDFFKELQPMAARECALVQLLADNSWRLDRVFALEMGLYALGRTQFANHFDDHAPALRSNLIEVHTFLTYEKQFRNLQLQFGRLCRQREKDTAELRQLQQERSKREKEDLELAAKAYTAAKHDRKPFDPAKFGFDFSIEDIESYLQGVRAAHLFDATLKQERDQAKHRATAA